MDITTKLAEMQVMHLQATALERLMELDELATEQQQSDRYIRLINLYQRLDVLGLKKVTESARSDSALSKLTRDVGAVQEQLTKNRRAATANTVAAVKQGQGGSNGSN